MFRARDDERFDWGCLAAGFTRKALVAEMNSHGPNQLGIKSGTKKEGMPDNKPLPGLMLRYFRSLLEGSGGIPLLSIPLKS